MLTSYRRSSGVDRRRERELRYASLWIADIRGGTRHLWSRELHVGWRSVDLEGFVCVGCGYTEAFVADLKMSRPIARQWPLALS